MEQKETDNLMTKESLCQIKLEISAIKADLTNIQACDLLIRTQRGAIRGMAKFLKTFHYIEKQPAFLDGKNTSNPKVDKEEKILLIETGVKSNEEANSPTTKSHQKKIRSPEPEPEPIQEDEQASKSASAMTNPEQRK